MDFTPATTPPQGPLAALRNFARQRPKVERCELCGKELGPDHQHLIEPGSRRLVCSCQACAMLFSGSTMLRFRTVPRRIEMLPDFRITDSQWDALHLPINLAFFFHSSKAGRVIAIFPSVAGPTESLLTFDAWQDLAGENPVLKELEPDVEALLVYRIGEDPQKHVYCRVPIDECFKLVGLIRTHWRGLSGGTEVWRELTNFMASLNDRSISPAARGFANQEPSPVAHGESHA